MVSSMAPEVGEPKCATYFRMESESDAGGCALGENSGESECESEGDESIIYEDVGVKTQASWARDRRELEASKLSFLKATKKQQQVDESVRLLLQRLDQLPGQSPLAKEGCLDTSDCDSIACDGGITECSLAGSASEMEQIMTGRHPQRIAAVAQLLRKGVNIAGISINSSVIGDEAPASPSKKAARIGYARADAKRCTRPTKSKSCTAETHLEAPSSLLNQKSCPARPVEQECREVARQPDQEQPVGHDLARSLFQQSYPNNVDNSLPMDPDSCQQAPRVLSPHATAFFAQQTLPQQSYPSNVENSVPADPDSCQQAPRVLSPHATAFFAQQSLPCFGTAAPSVQEPSVQEPPPLHISDDPSRDVGQVGGMTLAEGAGVMDIGGETSCHEADDIAASPPPTKHGRSPRIQCSPMFHTPVVNPPRESSQSPWAQGIRDVSVDPFSRWPVNSPERLGPAHVTVGQDWRGWSVQISGDGELFYFHEETNTSQWQTPRELLCILGDWAEATDESGNTYWANDLLNTSCWTDPRCTANVFQAAFDGDMFFVQLYIHGKGNVDVVDASGCTPLHYACASSHEDMALFLLESGAGADVPNLAKERPLHWACRYSHSDAIKLLLEAQADPDRPDQHGDAPLHLAASVDCTSAVQLLISARANPKQRSWKQGMLTPSEVAVAAGASSAAAMLQEYEQELVWQVGQSCRPSLTEQPTLQVFEPSGTSSDEASHSSSHEWSRPAPVTTSRYSPNPHAEEEPMSPVKVVARDLARVAKPLLRGVQWLANHIIPVDDTRTKAWGLGHGGPVLEHDNGFARFVAKIPRGALEKIREHQCFDDPPGFEHHSTNMDANPFAHDA